MTALSPLLLAIRDEIRAVEAGEITAEASPLRHAPHTVNDLVADWDRAYSREAGCFPPGAFRVDKYWPPIGRVDNVYGDRNLICTCPPLESYAQAQSRLQFHLCSNIPAGGMRG